MPPSSPLFCRVTDVNCTIALRVSGPQISTVVSDCLASSRLQFTPPNAARHCSCRVASNGVNEPLGLVQSLAKASGLIGAPFGGERLAMCPRNHELKLHFPTVHGRFLFLPIIFATGRTLAPPGGCVGSTVATMRPVAIITVETCTSHVPSSPPIYCYCCC